MPAAPACAATSTTSTSRSARATAMCSAPRPARSREVRASSGNPCTRTWSRRRRANEGRGGERVSAAEPFDLVRSPVEDGITLIEASAGTGKTYCLTGLVLRLLLERHVGGVGEILVMTFTIAATAELVERIRSA